MQSRAPAYCWILLFFFQAEDGIRDVAVTGVQTCALPILASVAFLLPRGELADFLARIAPVASRAVGVAVVPTGPWPAYSFVPTFDRPPLAPAAPPPTDRAADRRAG